MSSSACTQCGCTDIDIDQARGDAVCTNCGSVLEDQIIVSEVQFQENSAGGASVIGQYVSQDGTKSQGLGGFHHGFARESRTMTLQNGKKKIQQLGAQMKLNQHCIDTAFNFFKMAVTKRLTRGRKTNNVIAACLYLVCRTEGTPHMLLDFSDLLQTNVYSLGRTYLAISKELCINIPAIDPCLYVSRFAHKLEFGDKTHEVSMTALRLVQRMKRDWMHTGRRPSGLCGAAILVAARMHNFSRTVRDLIRVVKVCETTIRKRLTEFSDTASSQLTIDEFIKIDLEEEHDPPCYTESKRKAKLAHLEEHNKFSDLTAEVSSLQNEIEKSLEPRKPRGIFASYSKMGDNCEENDDVVAASNYLAEEAVKDATIDLLDDGVAVDVKDKTSVSQGHRLDVEEEPEVAKVESDKLQSLTRREALTAKGLTPSAASLGIKEVVEECMKEDTDSESVVIDMGGELDLEGINDEELDWMILTEEEVRVKTMVWMKANEDYLKEQKEKAERKKREEEEEALKPEKKKKRTYKKRPQQTGEASSAREALAKMLLEKKLSNKINYDVLNDLNCKAMKTESSTKPGPEVEPPPPTDVATPEVKVSKSILNRFKRSSVNFDVKREAQEDPDTKRVKFSQDTDVKPEVVIESGPIQYEAKDSAGVYNVDGEEEGDYEEDDFGDEENVSAAQLLGHDADRGYEEEQDEYYLDDD
ncbi:transcription factor IIIB 90 kDa subunit-like [Haliotis cracherodii]|uniref:transcription factor IIIB 90 kDa subunit-like n=1 Tax=Haliotis cracherodii TaxID=6455 RepID=UPI0039E8B285